MPTTILDGETYEQARHRRFTEEAKVIEKIHQQEMSMMSELCADRILKEREVCAKVCDEHGFLAKHPPQLSVQDQLRSKK